MIIFANPEFFNGIKFDPKANNGENFELWKEQAMAALRALTFGIKDNLKNSVQRNFLKLANKSPMYSEVFRFAESPIE